MSGNMTALDLAKYVVSKCENDGKPITNLQLQKILYYIQKLFLEKKDVAFFDDIEAWQFGPVVPNVYYYFCGFGAMPITVNFSSDLKIEYQNEVDRIIEEKRCLNPWDLVEDTHKPDGAWYSVYENGLGVRKIISLELIKEKG